MRHRNAKENNFNIGKCKFGEVLKLAEEVPLLRE